jgi:hypothetical protein
VSLLNVLLLVVCLDLTKRIVTPAVKEGRPLARALQDPRPRECIQSRTHSNTFEITHACSVDQKVHEHQGQRHAGK